MKETSTKESNSSSIQSRFLLSLALVTTAVVLLFSVVYISVLANVMKQDLNVEAERLVALSTKSLSSALWQYNKEYVNDYLDSLMLREQVVKVEVTTEDSTYTRESTKYKTAKRDMRLISSQSKIFHQKMEVGTIRLFLSAEPIAQRVKYLSAGAISFFMAIILMTSITVYWLTNKLLFAPLAELQETFKLISKGNLDAPISTARNDEIGQLAKEFKKMIDSINALTASRDELNHEIEERKRAETLLIQTEKLRAIGTLAGGIAHDFNNILHAIIGHAELAFDDAESDTEQAESLQEILGASMRARDLVQQILTFARQGEIKLVPVKVSSIASEVFRFIRSSTPTTIEMVNHFESKAKVLGVPTKLHQVLMNLCTNAIQSMEVNGGTLTITTNDVELDDEAAKKLGLAAGDYMRTEVRDTGAGIAQEDLNKVFDP